MDKKNTVLLTVIAVATLFVAVIGATFAYFSIAGNESDSTIVTTNTGGSGAVILTTTNSALKINLSADDMAQNLGGNTSYYSVLGNSSANYATSPENALQQVLLATVTNDKENEYECTGSVKIALSAKNPSTLDSLVDGDGAIVFGGVLDGMSKKLSEIKTGSLHELTIDNVKYTGLKEGISKEITAYIVINNTDVPQNYLQNESLSVSITAPSFSCKKAS